MKKLLFLLLFPFTLIAQTNIVEQSNGNTQTNNKGGLGLAKVFLLPLGNHDPLFEFTRYKSRIQYNESGNFIEFHNGTSWVRITDVVYGASNYYPLSGNPSGFLTSFTETDPTVPAYSKTLNGFAVIKASTDPLYKSISYTPTSLEITTALGYTPYNSTNPNSYINQSQARSAITVTTTGSGAATYNSATGQINIPTPASNTYTAGSGISIASNVISNTAPDQIVTLTAGNGITISGTYPNFTISTVQPVISIVTRTLNSNFTPSSTRNTIVSYTVTCSVTNPLLVGTSSATAYLEYSTNGGSTWLLPSQVGNSSGVGITVTLQLTNGQTGTLVGIIPANALTRIRTSISGTASVNYITGQETNL